MRQNFLHPRCPAENGLVILIGRWISACAESKNAEILRYARNDRRLRRASPKAQGAKLHRKIGAQFPATPVAQCSPFSAAGCVKSRPS